MIHHFCAFRQDRLCQCLLIITDKVSFRAKKQTVVWNPYATNKAYVELEFTPLGMGDINADGNFNVADVVALQKWIVCAKDAEKSIVEWKAGNFVDDERLDVFDLSLMKRALLAK